MDNRRLRPSAAAPNQAPWGAGDSGRLRALIAQLLGRSGGSALHVLNSLLEARSALPRTCSARSVADLAYHRRPVCEHLPCEAVSTHPNAPHYLLIPCGGRACAATAPSTAMNAADLVRPLPLRQGVQEYLRRSEASQRADAGSSAPAAMPSSSAQHGTPAASLREGTASSSAAAAPKERRGAQEQAQQAGASQAGGACGPSAHAGAPPAHGSSMLAGPSGRGWAEGQASPGLSQAPPGPADAGQMCGAHAGGRHAAGNPVPREAGALAEGAAPARALADPGHATPAREHPAAALGPLAPLDRVVLAQLAAVMQLVGQAARADSGRARRHGCSDQVSAFCIYPKSKN